MRKPFAYPRRTSRTSPALNEGKFLKGSVLRSLFSSSASRHCTMNLPRFTYDFFRSSWLEGVQGAERGVGSPSMGQSVHRLAVRIRSDHSRAPGDRAARARASMSLLLRLSGMEPRAWSWAS